MCYRLSIELIANYITIIGLPIAISSIIVAIFNINQSKKIEQGKFLIELRKMFSEHNYVHFNLRNGGKWTNNEIPDNLENWAKIDSYLGLFELCEILIQNKSLSEKHFKSQYLYRIENILSNDEIVLKKLRNENDSWNNLLRLISRFKIK